MASAVVAPTLSWPIILRLDGESALRNVTLTLIVLMMVVNALTKYVIFRARNLHLSYIIGNALRGMMVRDHCRRGQTLG